MAWAAGAALVVGGGTAGIVIAAQGSGQVPSATATTAATLGSLRLVSISDVPANGNTGSPASGTITVNAAISYTASNAIAPTPSIL